MHTFAMRNRRRNMTTIQIAVVVALVFFAVISVVVLIVWKRETEMRTNSIRFIEDTLVNIRDGLSENNDLVAGELLRMNREAPEVPEVHQDRIDGSGSGQTPERDVYAETSPEAYPDMQCRQTQTEMCADTYRPVMQADIPPQHAVFTGGDLWQSERPEHDSYSNAGIYDNTQRPIYEGRDNAGHYSGSYDGYFGNDADGSGEISLDFMDQDMMAGGTGSLFDDDLMTAPDEKMMHGIGSSVNTGRSGRTYTVSELETLIKE